MVLHLVLELWDGGTIVQGVTDSINIEDEEEAFKVFNEHARTFTRIRPSHRQLSDESKPDAKGLG